MNTSSGTQRIWATSPGVRKVFLPMTMPETRRAAFVPAAFVPAASSLAGRESSAGPESA